METAPSMLLLLLLVIGAPKPAPGAQNDLSIYLRVAAEYRTGGRERALQAIRGWRPAEIRAGIRAVREEADRLRPVILDEGLVSPSSDRD